MLKRATLGCLLLSSLVAMSQQPIVWRFDNLSHIGSNAPTIIGTPKLIDTELGKAVHFEGNATAGDALFFDTLPLSGTLPYTWEVIFRPSSAGGKEQRFFHLQEDGAETRRLFETRLVDGKWCLDSFAVNVVPNETAHSAVLLKCDAEHLFPLDRWYAVAAIYDGKTLRSYINGILQGEADVKLFPLGRGGVSVGTRYNKRDFFTGDIFSARFTPRPLLLKDLLRVPAGRAVPATSP
jgi:Concanavalin A-like lectin/glucanases superfamily